MKILANRLRFIRVVVVVSSAMLCSLVLTSCNSNEQTKSRDSRVSIPQTLELVMDSTPPNIHSHTEFIDIQGEYLSAKMRPVRNNVKRIDSIKNWTEITKKAIIDSTHQLDATFYYQNRILEKVVLIQKDEVSEVETKFFLLDNDISFVVEKTTSRVNSKAEVILDESYFENGKLFNQLNNQDCGSPFSKEYLRKEQERIYAKFAKINQ